jgi:hypothetical protein
MQKFLIFCIYIALATMVAGIFGAVHDQVSYSFSHEYFTRFKFEQFHLLDESIPERVRAAEVGFRASWWMGIPLGFLAGLAGFIQPTESQQRRALLLSLPLIAGFTLLIALAGLAYGFMQTTTLDLQHYSGWLPPLLDHPRAFICVGYMHNAAYLGGAASIPVAWVFHLRYRRRRVQMVELSNPGSE